MKTRRLNLAAALCGLSLALFARAGAAQEITPGQGYRELRGALIQHGWRPNTAYGLKRINSGAPLYRYPEIVCGPKLCKAKWRDNAGHERAIMILRAFNNDEYRVAPQQ